MEGKYNQLFLLIQMLFIHKVPITSPALTCPHSQNCSVLAKFRFMVLTFENQKKCK